ncbi:MAG: hypothetical protein FOGNACKC_03180 [Anaerolineae bacterium]|nr:hypothetical protein [Anaerolineae bacterium]
MTRFFFVLVIIPAIVAGVMLSTGHALFDTDNLAERWPSQLPRAQGGTIPPAADLALSKTAAPSPVPAGMPLTYTLVITNYGPSDVTDAILTDALPDDVSLNMAFASQGSCHGTVIVVCNVGAISSSATVTATLVVTTVAGDPVVNMAYVTSFTTNDANPDNNTATATTVIGPAPAPGNLFIYLPLVLK